MPPVEKHARTLDAPDVEIKAVAERPSEILDTMENVDTRPGVLAVPGDAFGNGVLGDGDEADHVTWFDVAAGEPEAEAEVHLGVGDEEAVGE